MHGPFICPMNRTGTVKNTIENDILDGGKVDGRMLLYVQIGRLKHRITVIF